MVRAALLFDLDGTLVDTDHLHHAAFVTILGERDRAVEAHDRRVLHADQAVVEGEDGGPVGGTLGQMGRDDCGLQDVGAGRA